MADTFLRRSIQVIHKDMRYMHFNKSWKKYSFLFNKKYITVKHAPKHLGIMQYNESW